jgi:hypothetical protein
LNCEEELDPNVGIIDTPDGILDAPTVLSVNDREYILDAFIWRDFMPSTDPGLQLLMAAIDLVDQDSTDMADNVALEFLWLVKGDTTWATTFTDEGRLNLGYKLHEMARNGPEWEIGAQVDVVVKVLIENKEYRLQLAGQTIQATC